MPFEKGHALIIGISQHRNLAALNHPIIARDAEAIEQALTDPATCAYDGARVRRLADGAATRAGILNELKKLADATGEDDTVLLFYVGHGMKDEDGNFCLVSHDADGDKSRLKRGTGVGQAQLLDALRKIKAGRVLLIFNACMSGNIAGHLGAGEAEAATLNPSPDLADALLGTGKGRIVINACGANQRSLFGQNDDRTLFTQALIAGLQGEGVPATETVITAFRLFERLAVSVKAKANQRWGETQEPEMNTVKVNGPFPVALHQVAAAPAAAGGAAGPAAGLGALDEQALAEAGYNVRIVSVAQTIERLEYFINSGGGNVFTGNISVGGGGDFVGGDKYVGLSYEQVVDLFHELRDDAQAKTFTGRQPYIGLAAFDENNADLFFGREKLVADLLKRIDRSRFVCISGPSGSGKSSLARAGLMYALGKERLTGSDVWLRETFTPGANPLDQLATAAGNLARKENLPFLSTRDETRQTCEQDPAAFGQSMSALVSGTPGRRVVLLVDQFEEAFTLAKPRDTAILIENLARAANDTDGRVSVVMAMRSDFESKCAKYPALRALISQEYELVGAMEPDELARAIASPAFAVGVDVEPELIQQIIGDVKGEPSALPLMQFALRDLFNAAPRQAGDKIVLTKADYLARGGLTQALERRANETFDKFTPAQKDMARTVFKRLITVGRGALDTRRTAKIGELAPAGGEGEQVRALITNLASERLLSTSGSENDETVTIAHERLIDAWPWLRKLVDENREAIELQVKITSAAREWVEAGRNSDFLFTEYRLGLVQQQLNQKQIQLDAAETEFIEESKRRNLAELQRERERADELQRALREARSRGMLTLSSNLLGSGSELALLIALEAHKLQPTFESADVLRRVLRTTPLRVLSGHTDAVWSARFSPDGRSLVTASGDGTVSAWDARSGQRTVMSQQDDGLTAAYFSPDGKLIATLDVEGTVRLWRAGASSAPNTNLVGACVDGSSPALAAQFSTDSQRLGVAYLAVKSRLQNVVIWQAEPFGESSRIELNAGDVAWARFSFDVSALITAHEDGAPRVWSTSTGEVLSILRGHEGPVLGAIFAYNSKRVLTYGGDNTARIWDALSGNEVCLLRGHERPISTAQFSRDGDLALTASADGTARVWNANTGAVISILRGHEQAVVAARFSPLGNQVVTASEDRTARVWNAATGNELAVLRGHATTILCADFSRTGAALVTAAYDGEVRLWPASNGEEHVAFSGLVARAEFRPAGQPHLLLVGRNASLRVCDPANGETLWNSGVAYSAHDATYTPDGARALVVANSGAAVKLLDAESGAELSAFAPTTGSVTQVLSLALDGSLVVVAFNDGRIETLDLRTGVVVAALRRPGSRARAMCLSPNGQWLAVLSEDGTLGVFDVAVGAQRAEVFAEDDPIASVWFSPDSQTVLTVGKNLSLVNAWDPNSGAPTLAPFSNFKLAHPMQISPDGQFVVVPGADGSSTTGGGYVRVEDTARVWDAASHREVFALTGHTSRVIAARYSPDGKFIVTLSWDKTARLWNAVTGEELGVLRGHDRAPSDAHFSHDGRWLATISDDAVTRVFYTQADDLAANAAARVIRPLNEQERAQYHL